MASPRPWTLLPPPPPPPPPPPQQVGAPPRHIATDRPKSPHRNNGLNPAPSLETTAASTSNYSSSRSTRSIVEERRRAAMAIYESKDLMEIDHFEHDEELRCIPIHKNESEAWDPVMMDRLSPTEENDYEDVDGEALPSPRAGFAPDQKSSKRQPMSPVSDFRNQLQSPKRKPMSPRQITSLHQMDISPLSRRALETVDRDVLRSKSLFDATSVANSVDTGLQSARAPSAAESPSNSESQEPPSPTPRSVRTEQTWASSAKEARSVQTEQTWASSAKGARSVRTEQTWASSAKGARSISDMRSVTSELQSINEERSISDMRSMASELQSLNEMPSISDIRSGAPSARELPVVHEAPSFPSVQISSMSSGSSSMGIPAPPQAARHESSTRPATSPAKSPGKATEKSPHVLMPKAPHTSTTRKSPLTSTAKSPRTKTAQRKIKSVKVEARKVDGSDDAAVIFKGKRGFLNKMLGRRAKEKYGVVEHPSHTIPTKSRTKKKTKKQIEDERIGCPLDIKPGMSYMSTPHSAEIVVRKAADAEPIAHEQAPVGLVPEDENAMVQNDDGYPMHESVLSGSSSREEDDQLEEAESFSQPEFENIEEATNPSVSHSLDQGSYFKPLKAFPRDDEVSAITEPSYEHEKKENRGHDLAEIVTMQRENAESTSGSDPVGRMWSEIENQNTHQPRDATPIDPFASPFFKDDASEATNPVANHKYVDAPDDEIPLNHDQLVDMLCQLGDTKGLDIRELLEQQASLRAKKHIDSSQHEHKEGLSPRSISERRHEIAERRKMIEEKLKAVGVSPVAATPDLRDEPILSSQSRISDKAFSYLQDHKSPGRNRAVPVTSPRTPPGRNRTVPVTFPRTAQRTQASEALHVQHTSALLGRFQDRKQGSSFQASLAVRSPSMQSVSQGKSPVLPSSLTRSAARTLSTPENPVEPGPVSSPSSAMTRVRKESRPEHPLGMSRLPPPLESQRTPKRSGRQNQVKSLAQPQHVETNESKSLEVDSASISIGLALKRQRHKFLISHGDTVIVRRPPRKKPVVLEIGPVSSEYDILNIRDPIKRAGIRLLSKSALSIQTQIRRYLAQQNAVDRLWAIVELQSYFRRWKCEVFLHAQTYLASRIQATFRGWQARKILEDEHFASTQIQRIARGYISFVKTYDRLYRVVLVQAATRGMLARIKFQKCAKSVITIQRCFRGFVGRIEVATWNVAAAIIQAQGRAYLVRLQYQFDVVDIITAQSAVRRWLAIRQVKRVKNVILVSRWAAVQRKQNALRNYAALRIQTVWRTHQATTNFVFVLADVLRVQTAARLWLSKKKPTSLRQDAATTKIQARWRGFRARDVILYKLVNIIIVQSVIRRHLARKLATELREWVEAMPTLNVAATNIQAAWRGFWQFSHYLIFRYELVKLQTAVRGHIVRRNARLRLGCIIILQATMRRYLVQKHINADEITALLVSSASYSQLETSAATRIQKSWRNHEEYKNKATAAISLIQQSWRNHAECKKNKATAAITLIQQSWRNHAECKKNRATAAITLIQQSWRNHAECKKNKAIAATARIQQSWRNYAECKKNKAIAATARIQECWRNHAENRKNKAAAEYQKNKTAAEYQKNKAAALTIERFFLMVKSEVDREVLRCQRKKHHEYKHSSRERAEAEESFLERAWLNTVDESASGIVDPGYNKTMERYRSMRRRVPRPTEAVQLHHHADDVSDVTAPSVFAARVPTTTAPPSRYAAYYKRELSDELRSEQPWLDTDAHQSRRQRQMEEEYLRQHGISEPVGRMNTPRHHNRVCPSQDSPRERNNSRYSPNGHKSPRYHHHPHPHGEYESLPGDGQRMRTPHGHGHSNRHDRSTYSSSKSSHGDYGQPHRHNHRHNHHQQQQERYGSRERSASRGHDPHMLYERENLEYSSQWSPPPPPRPMHSYERGRSHSPYERKSRHTNSNPDYEQFPPEMYYRKRMV